MSAAELLVSADSHAAMSHEDVKARLAGRFHDSYDAAVLEFAAEMGRSGWRRSADDDEATDSGQDATADGAGRGQFGATATNSQIGIAGHSDPQARLADMDIDGVDVEVVYCEVSAFRYLYLMKDGAAAATTAFNDAMIDFAAADPTRLIANAQIPIHDIEAAVAEVHRVSDAGIRSLQLPVFPPELGLPDYYDDRYDPLWAAVSETGQPICCHIGLNTMLADLGHRDPTPGKSIAIPMVGLSTGEALGMWIVAGVFERFPELRVVFVEPGLGWVAWWLQIADDMVLRQGYANPLITQLPSDYFHRNVFLTFIDEPDVLQSPRILERLGVENLMWSTDYPHPVTSWPNSQKVIDETFAGVPAPQRELMLSGNARRVWNL